jgi:hypothetical protein
MERSSGPSKTPFNLSESTHHQLQACTRWRQAQLGVGVVAILLVLFAISAQAQTSITIGYYAYDGVFWKNNQVNSYYEFELDTRGITKEPIKFHNIMINIKGAISGTYPEFPYITTGEKCGLEKFPQGNQEMTLVKTGGQFNPCDILFTPIPKGFQCATTTDQGITWKQNCISIALQIVAPGAKDFTVELVDGTTFCAPGITNIFLEAQPDIRMLDPGCSGIWCKGIKVPIVLNASSTCK